ncbi:MAG: hypothetical protein HY231_15245 [Acidobacteria bacterium]|nr:hypothetical protein [Acidobacteriota bacterium]
MLSDEDRDTEPQMTSITPSEWEERKQFVGFGVQDQMILRELHLVARSYADEIMDELYRRWLQQDELKKYFPDEATLTHVKAMQKAYFISLTQGEYGAAYLANRLHIGRVHYRIGLTPRWYIGSYAIYLELVLPKVLSAFEYDRVKQQQAITALTKIIALDQELALIAYWEHSAT